MRHGMVARVSVSAVLDVLRAVRCQRRHFRLLFFLREAVEVGRNASVHAVVNCLVVLAASRLTAAVACALADPAILFAVLKNRLIKGFFMMEMIDE